MRGLGLVVLCCLTAPVLAGIAATVLSAFGWMPGADGGGSPLDAWRRLFAEPSLARSALLGGLVGAIAAMFALAAVIAGLAATWGTPVGRAVTALLSPLLSVPHAAAAFALAFLIAPSGWILRLLSPWATGFDRPPDLLIVNDPWAGAMLAGLTLKEIPFLYLVALAAIPQTRPSERLAVAASLGYGRFKGFLVGVAPDLMSRLRLPLAAVAAYGSSVVDVALVLGPTGPATLAVRIVQWANLPDLSWRSVAAAGALLQAAVAAAAVLAVLGLEALARSALIRFGRSGRRHASDRTIRVVAGAGLAVPAMIMAAGLVALALWSIAGPWRFPDAWPTTLGTATWTAVWPSLSRAVVDSLWIGLVATGATTAGTVILLATLAGGRPPPEIVSGILFLPLLVPEVTWIFGLDLALLAAGATAGPVPVLIGNVVLIAPYVWLSLVGPWAGLDPRYERVAASLGASPLRRLAAVRLPMLAGPLMTAAAIGFAVSVAIYLPTLVLGGGRVATVTTEAVALASGADRRIVGATALVQAVLPFAGFALAAVLMWGLGHRRRALGGTR